MSFVCTYIDVIWKNILAMVVHRGWVGHKARLKKKGKERKHNKRGGGATLLFLHPVQNHLPAQSTQPTLMLREVFLAPRNGGEIARLLQGWNQERDQQVALRQNVQASNRGHLPATEVRNWSLETICSDSQWLEWAQDWNGETWLQSLTLWGQTSQEA